jgi:hypothetical protein
MCRFSDGLRGYSRSKNEHGGLCLRAYFVLGGEKAASRNFDGSGFDGSGLDASGFDRRLIDQHDGDFVFHWVNAVAGATLQTLGVLTVVHRLLARGTDERFEKVFVEHAEILR